MLLLTGVNGSELADKTSSKDYRHFAMIHQGDLDQGRLLFESPQLACVLCHTVNGDNTKAGPDLSGIGDKLGRGDIIDAILEPSAVITDGFNLTEVETRDGAAHSGIIKAATNEWIELKGVGPDPIRIASQNIVKRQTLSVSMMPEGLHQGLSVQGFADLVDFLVSRKQVDNARVFDAGTPQVIARIAEPIGLIPFYAQQFQFDRPVWFGQIPGEADSFLVLEHAVGKIWLMERKSHGIDRTLFLDLGAGISQGGARGLLGLAFHPGFRDNQRYFLALHVNENGRHAALTVERKASLDLKRDSGMSSRTILRWEATTSSHTGGGVEFGPDGFLYVGMGDTGPHEDPNGHAQNLLLLKGKMLRVDVDAHSDGRPYSIPSDNPFVNDSRMRPEIWSSGFREPWRFSFDSLTGELWVGDVGQDRYEEVTIVRKGENHGWNVWEGFERFSNQYRTEGTQYVKPVFAYGRKEGVSIVGGHVYRKDKDSTFYGVYIFGDHQSRQIWGLTQVDRSLSQILKIGTAPQKIVAFSQSESGDLFLVGYDGTIYRIDLSQSVFRKSATPFTEEL